MSKHVFQAEVKQLLQLMIHSMYSNKEIFLRELISNASDACDKLRFAAVENPALNTGDLAIQLSFNKEAKTLTIADNGLGMTAEEAQNHLGTIAKSGTKEFFSNLSGDQQKDAALIGQFGVGFYSAFIVAHTVTVVTRKAATAADTASQWESSADGEYTLTTVTKDTVGTTITLHLRDEETEFADRWRISGLVKKYSDHIGFPIQMQKEEWDEETKAMKTLDEMETINQAASLWTRAKADITTEEYEAFYQSLSYDQSAPLAYTHNRVEGGRSEYTQLLFIPGAAPFDLFDRERTAGVKLYVKRVFIMDDAKALMPSYLRFVRGVIDSQDLPLNVSRELLQESRDVKAIREGSTKKVLGMLEDMANNEDAAQKEKYATFWGIFGQVLKEGVGEDFANKERLAKLLRFNSTYTTAHAASSDDAQTVSFADYVSRMKPEQTTIYVLTADNLVAAKSSPHLELFKQKGIEVLLLTERVDEWMLSHLRDFDGKPIKSVAKGAADLGALQDEAEKKAAETVADDLKPVVDFIKTALGDRVKDVRVTQRLTSSAACLVAEENEMSGHLQRLLKQAGQAAPDSKPILEINPTHNLVNKIKLNLASAGENADANVMAKTTAASNDLCLILLDHATLAEGGQLTDPAAYVARVNALLA